MKNFIVFNLFSNIEQDKALKIFETALPQFNWTMGDSDEVGRSISGDNQDSVWIKVWFDENPFSVSVSFRSAWKDCADRENRKEQLIGQIKQNVIPLIGEIRDIEEWN